MIVNRDNNTEEELYQRYPLIDLEIATSEWDPEEIAVLYSVLRKERVPDEAAVLIAGWLRRRARTAGWRFHPETYKTPGHIRREMEDLDRYLDNYRRGTPLKIPEPVLAFIHILETEPDRYQEILQQAEIRDLMDSIDSMTGRESGVEEDPEQRIDAAAGSSLPPEAVEPEESTPKVNTPESGTPEAVEPEAGKPEESVEDAAALPVLPRIRLLIDGAILWNIHLQTGLDFRCWQLRDVILREGVRFIDQSVFACCVNLRAVTIPDSVRKIGIGTFALCPSLEQIRISEKAAERLFSPVRIREGSYLQIGCRCFEHFEWTGPRDAVMDRPLLGHSAVTNDSDYLKAPWYVRRVKAAVPYNQYTDPRYPRLPEELEKIRQGMPRPGEIVFCPACFTPYSRELRSLLSACPHCGRLLLQKKGETDPAFILRRYDRMPEAVPPAGHDPNEEAINMRYKKGVPAAGPDPNVETFNMRCKKAVPAAGPDPGAVEEKAAVWRGVLRILADRACDPVLLAGICREAMDRGQDRALLTLSMSRDLAGGGSLPAAFADPGVSVYMAWQKERENGKETDPDRIERRKKQYGYTGEVFDRILGSELVPLFLAAGRAGLRITRTDWTYTVPKTGLEETDQILRKKQALTEKEKQAILQKWQLTLLLTLRWDRPERDRRLTAADLLRLPLGKAFRKKNREENT